MTREPIYAALWDLVSAAPGLVLTSRKLKHWEDVQQSEMPALFMAQGAQVAHIQTNLPTIWELDVTLWLYVGTQDASSPGEVANPIMDAITGMLAWVPSITKQTLGGLVHYARIEGTIETSEGTLGNTEVLRIPVKIKTTD